MSYLLINSAFLVALYNVCLNIMLDSWMKTESKGDSRYTIFNFLMEPDREPLLSEGILRVLFFVLLITPPFSLVMLFLLAWAVFIHAKHALQ